MKIYLNDKKGNREIVETELIEDRPRSVVVRLPDKKGHIIVRKKSRQVVK